MEPRTIPFLTREPVYPVEVPEIRVVNPPNIDSSFHIKPYFAPEDSSSNPIPIDAVAVTVIDSPAAQEIILPPSQMIWGGGCFLNGKRMEAVEPKLWLTPSKVNRGRLKKGENVLAFRMHGTTHNYDVSLCGVTKAPVSLRSPAGEGQWMVWAGGGNLDAIAACAGVEKLRPYIAEGRLVQQQHMARTNVFNLTAWPLQTKDKPQVEGPENCLTDNAEITAVMPAANGDTELLLDFGRELIGYVEMELDAEEGVTIDANHFEGIESIGRHYTLGNLNSFRYVTKAGRQVFRSFWRRGFRYMTLTVRGNREPVRLHWVRCLLSTYPSVERGAFRCSDPLLTRIWEVGRYTLRMCSEDTFTDCPTYEQTLWVGDSRNEALVNYAAYGDEPLTARCVLLPVHSLRRSVLTESQVPSAWQNVLTAWSLMWMMMVEEHYQWSGNIETLKQAYPGVLGNANACRKLLDERGLLSIDAWNMFDWAPQDASHKVVTHNQMFLAGALCSAETAALALKKRSDAKMFRRFREELTDAINKHLWSAKQKAYIDSIHNDGTPSSVCSQQTNGLAILYKVAPPERARNIARMIVDAPDGVVKVGSPFALFFTLEALAGEARHDELLSIVRSRWGAMVNAGATTFWETFPGWERQFVSRSLCHAWSAGPTYFLSRYQLGVEAAAPGFARAMIRPVPADMEWCAGSAPTPKGKISVSWKRSDGAFGISVELPPDVPADVELPVSAAKHPKLFFDGEKARPAGVKVLKKNDRWLVSVPKGSRVCVEARR